MKKTRSHVRSTAFAPLMTGALMVGTLMMGALPAPALAEGPPPGPPADHKELPPVPTPDFSDQLNIPDKPTEAQKSLADMTQFVDRTGALSGAVQACSVTESNLIDECGNLILSNWQKVTGEKAVDGTGVRDVFRAAWNKRKAEGLYALKQEKGYDCNMVLETERRDTIWKVCVRPEVTDTPGSGETFQLN
ncbi:hypothetical protein LDL36_18070 [Komagataeibacter sp. FNDCR1]|nr:hypothetical protein [Komagataeibacter sp. FNDCR1]